MVADELLAEIGAAQDAWDREHARDLLTSVEDLPAHVREARLLRAATGPVMGPVIRLAACRLPGSDLSEDAEWATWVALGRREVLAYRAAGIDHGIAERNLRLIDRIGSLIGTWPEPEWTAAVRRDVACAVDARERGRTLGEQINARLPPGDLRRDPGVGWLLRHPADHHLLQARARIADPWICAHIDDHAAELAPSYAAMAAQDWSAEERCSDLVVELQLSDQAPHDWTKPVSGIVRATYRGSATVGSELAVRQVADTKAQFNGTLVAFLPGELWLVCATRHDDGTVLPDAGTRRLQAPNSAGK